MRVEIAPHIHDMAVTDAVLLEELVEANLPQTDLSMIAK